MFKTMLRAATLAAICTLPSLRAQVQVFGGPDPDRKGSSVIMFSDTMMAGIAISYSAPVWKEQYNQMLDSLKGKNLRLGKNWWTSFDTSVPAVIGGVRIEAGSYFLGMHCDKDGKFSLLLFAAADAMKGNLMPFAEDAWKGGTSAPLTLAKDSLKEPAKSMVIAIEADAKNPASGMFRVQWGPHELTAPVTFVLPSDKKK
jgi:hypothetical protein